MVDFNISICAPTCTAMCMLMLMFTCRHHLDFFSYDNHNIIFNINMNIAIIYNNMNINISIIFNI